MECVRVSLVGLFWARICPAISDGDLELVNKFIDQFWFFLKEIILLCRVIGQVIELQQWELLVLECCRRPWGTPTSGSRAKGQFPWSLADGKGSVDGMVDGKGTRGLVGCIVGKNFEKRERILSGILGYLTFPAKDISHGSKEVRRADGLA